MSRYTRNFSSRLGRYEKPRFGGSGVGDQFGSQFGDVASAKAKWEKAGAAAAKLGTWPRILYDTRYGMQTLARGSCGRSK